MSFWKGIVRHEMSRDGAAVLSARALLRGDASAARFHAERSATSNHLAYELADTARIASQAQTEYIKARLRDRAERAA